MTQVSWSIKNTCEQLVLLVPSCTQLDTIVCNRSTLKSFYMQFNLWSTESNCLLPITVELAYVRKSWRHQVHCFLVVYVLCTLWVISHKKTGPFFIWA